MSCREVGRRFKTAPTMTKRKPIFALLVPQFNWARVVYGITNVHTAVADGQSNLALKPVDCARNYCIAVETSQRKRPRAKY